MVNLDPTKLLVIAIVAIIVLGPNKLPSFARQVGAAWRSFTAFRERMELEVRGSLPDLPSTTDLATYVRSPTVLLDRLAAPAPEEAPAASPARASELPTIGRPGQPHWTSISYDDVPPHTSVERAGNDAEHPLVVDVTLN